MCTCGEHMHNSQRTVNNSFQSKAAQNQSCPKFLEVYLFVCIISFLKICAYAESCLSIKITVCETTFFFWFFRFCSHIFLYFFPTLCLLWFVFRLMRWVFHFYFIINRYFNSIIIVFLWIYLIFISFFFFFLIKGDQNKLRLEVASKRTDELLKKWHNRCVTFLHLYTGKSQKLRWRSNFKIILLEQ